MTIDSKLNLALSIYRAIQRELTNLELALSLGERDHNHFAVKKLRTLKRQLARIKAAINSQAGLASDSHSFTISSPKQIA